MAFLLALIQRKPRSDCLEGANHVAEVFTGSPGKLVLLADTIKGFKGLVNGEYDHLPEAALSMVGTIEEAVEKAAKLAKEAA